MEILVIFLLIMINAVFALSEIAFVSARREIIEAERDKGIRNAHIVLKMMNEPDRFLSSIQVGITLIGVTSGIYAGISVADDISKLILFTGLSQEMAADISLVLVAGIITYLSIVLGELVPKAVALKAPEAVIIRIIPIIRIFSILTHPVVVFLSWSTRMILRIFGIKISIIDSSDDPLREILGIAKAAAVRNKISQEQAGIIAKTARLQSTLLRQIMVKRDDIKHLTTDMSLHEALLASHVHHHTRFPLLDTGNGKFTGYINFKDIVNTLQLNPANPSLRGICRPIISFKETDSINKALQRLITTHQHIALILDAGETVTGMVTMEDILEMIVGEIRDEYDTLPDHFYEIAPGRFVIGGGILLNKLRSLIGNAVPDDERSLDLFIRQRLGSNIKVESFFDYNGLRYIIRKVSRSHVYEVILQSYTGE